MKSYLAVFLVILGTVTYGQKITANFYFKDVDSLLRIKEKEATICSIHSDDVDTNGTSEKWIYWYFSQIIKTHPIYVLSAVDSAAKFDSLWTNFHLDGLSVINEKKWIDSDSAFTLAEKAGGQNFRRTHPNCKISVSLGQPGVPNSEAYWYIDYKSTDNPNDYFYIPIKAADKNLSNLDEHIKPILNQYQLAQNYPNPFNPVTTISYSIPKQSYIELKVYDLLGREVTTMVSKEQSAGKYKVKLSTSSLPSGIYIYTLQAGSFRSSKKFLLLK